jgi:hypothetical protein
MAKNSGLHYLLIRSKGSESVVTYTDEEIDELFDRHEQARLNAGEGIGHAKFGIVVDMVAAARKVLA